jgi:hypothetical protein
MGKWTFEEAQAHLWRWSNSYERLPMVLSLCRKMATSDWWRLLGHAWPSFDNVATHKLSLRAYLLKASPNNLSAMMRSHERRVLRLLPPVITIYRGCYDVNRDGLSWTLCQDIATRFPTLKRYRRNGDVPLLLRGRIDRARAVLMLGRNEREVICPIVEVTDEQPIGSPDLSA